MAARRKTAGRIAGKRAMAGGALVIAAATLLLATELPQSLSSAVGSSTALAQLAARSPGVRVGGVALKAKSPRLGAANLAPAAGTATPGSAVASVLGNSAGPEGAVPASGPVGPGGFPSDFFPPDVPGVPGLVGAAAPSTGGPGTGFNTSTLPPIGGLTILVPGGGSGGVGGGGGSPGGATPGTGTQPGGETPGGQTPGGGTILPPAPPPPVPGAGAIPEPSTWLMLIGGFGMIGGAMRRRRRVQLA